MFKLEFTATKKLGVIDTEDTSVSEAIYSIYLGDDDDKHVTMTFGNYFIYLTRRWDISVTYNDIIYMLKDLNGNNNEFRTSFLCVGFTLYWNFVRKGNSVTITPQWIEVGLEDRETNLFVENVREANFPITIDTEVFISEWNRLLKSIKDDLLKVGYTEDLENFEYLKELK
ncbi:hypothetical protein [Chryseobacterium schmidteae]|uniref:hypothetical protein n=1 Tax=Chryseobacterium schmidteae TaxID=2730404 RepID=UPI00158F3B42|nr:hypothetical protein [Chryseobacterium schmidteae]